MSYLIGVFVILVAIGAALWFVYPWVRTWHHAWYWEPQINELQTKIDRNEKRNAGIREQGFGAVLNMDAYNGAMAKDVAARDADNNPINWIRHWWPK